MACPAYYIENISCSDDRVYREFDFLKDAADHAVLLVHNTKYGIAVRRIGTDGMVLKVFPGVEGIGTRLLPHLPAIALGLVLCAVLAVEVLR